MRTLFATILLLLLPLPAVTAQDNCPTLETALATAEQSCSAMGSKEICLGNGRMEVVFNSETLPVFASPGDTAPLDVTCRVQSSEWGIAMMTMRPTDAAHDVTYILLGDVALQNVCSRSLRQTATATSDFDIYSQPAPPYEAIGQVAAGETIDVNACNCTGHWLRTVLDDGRVGWLLARNVEITGAADALPVVTADTPIYAPMQAFALHSSLVETPCSGATPDGLLIQTPAAMESVPLQMNGAAVGVLGTAFVQLQPAGTLTISVLDGMVRVTVDTYTATVPAGACAVVPLTEDDAVGGLPQVEVLGVEASAALPLALLPETVAAQAAPDVPVIVGAEACAVRSDRGETTCPLHFINADGDAITRMDIEFVKAPQGDWHGAAVENPVVLADSATGGTLAWKAVCSLGGGANFIGPVEWNIRLTDSQGHTSEPFAASFNCIEG